MDPLLLGSLVARYSAALQAADGAALAACFHSDARYHSALTALDSSVRRPAQKAAAQASAAQVTETEEAEPDADQSIPASALPSFFAALARSLRQRRIEIHSTLFDSAPTVTTGQSASASGDGRQCFVSYTLSGLWSGRLPSMVVGVYDKPIRLRCIDCLTIRQFDNGSAAPPSPPLVAVAEARVHMDRLQFLVQIGMARASL